MAAFDDFDPAIGMYSINQRKFPAEERMKYAGLWIAWSLDGTRILASGKTFEETMAQMTAAGLDPRKAVWDEEPPLEEDTIL